MPLDHASPDKLLPDYVPPEEIEEIRRRGKEERANRRLVLLAYMVAFALVLLSGLFLW